MLIHGDALEEIDELEENSIHAVITDPHIIMRMALVVKIGMILEQVRSIKNGVKNGHLHVKEC